MIETFFQNLGAGMVILHNMYDHQTKFQQKLFKINIRILKLDQIQLSGFEFLNQIKNIEK